MSELKYVSNCFHPYFVMPIKLHTDKLGIIENFKNVTTIGTHSED